MSKHPILDALMKPRFSILALAIPGLVLASLLAWNGTLANSWPALFINPAANQTILPVLVNELLAHTDPPQKDTVELYNPNQQDVNISGWYLSDALDKPKKFKIPGNTIISAGGYRLFTPDDFDLEARFVYSAEGEEVYLFATNAAGQLTGYYHGFSFGASQNGVSFGRYVTSTGKEEFPVQSAPTLGTANAGPQMGPIVISAIAYHLNRGDEYIELTNISTQTVPLFDPKAATNTWRLLGIGDYAFPPNLSLSPGATILVVPNEPNTFRATYGIATEVQIIGPYPRELANTGTRLLLQMPDPPNQDGLVPYVEVDRVEYANGAPWQSASAEQDTILRRLDLNAYGNDPANWVVEKP